MKNRYHVIVVLLFLSSIYAFGSDTLRVMTYNLLDYPGTDANIRDPYFRAVLHSAKPDVFIAEEVQDAAGMDNFRTDVLNYYQPGLYSSVAYHAGPDTNNSLFYDSTKVTVINVAYLATDLRDIAEYVIKPRWSDATLRIFAVHLKADNTTSAAQQRLSEATTLRNYLNSLPSGTNFIIVGDYNIYSSNEPAYHELVDSSANNNGRVKDPLNMTGTWNNSAYAQYHTQSTRRRSFGGGATGGLNDRFDMILPSFSVYANNMIRSSYKPYGNDGHHYNDSINQMPNTAVPDSVANGLHYSSDHLPVICDFTFPDSAASVTYTMNVVNGWNMISLPVNVSNARKDDLFPSAASSAYYFSSSSEYAYDISLRNDVGYWLKFSADQSLQLIGKPRESDTVNVISGWNLIGTGTYDVPVSNVIALPDSNVISSFFGFNGQYYFADTLHSGAAYFVKMNASGKIILH